MMNALESICIADPKPWASLEEFKDWYMASGHPLNMSAGTRVYRTDNASSVLLYQHLNFAVELYLLDDADLVDHAHPNVELLQMFPLGEANGVMQWHVNQVLPAGQYHGLHERSVVPPVFLVFERWINGARPASAAIDWKGSIVGPKHRALLREHSPKTHIVNGVAQ